MEKYGNYLQKNGYQIRVLNLKNMESSDRYNPFVYIRTEDDIPRLIMNIFKSVEPPDAKKATLSGMMVALFICSLSFISCGLYLYQIKKRFLQKPV